MNICLLTMKFEYPLKVPGNQWTLFRSIKCNCNMNKMTKCLWHETTIQWTFHFQDLRIPLPCFKNAFKIFVTVLNLPTCDKEESSESVNEK